MNGSYCYILQINNLLATFYTEYTEYTLKSSTPWQYYDLKISS